MLLWQSDIEREMDGKVTSSESSKPKNSRIEIVEEYEEDLDALDFEGYVV